MKLALFGATGLTGGLVLSQALEQGHEVTALVRDPSRMSLSHRQLTVLGGSPTVSEDVGRCVRGADALIHCLGIGGKGDGRPTTLVSDSVQVVLAAMAKQGVPRIVCMSNVGAGSSGTWFANRIVLPLFVRWLLPIIEDKDRMEAALRASAPNGSRCACRTSSRARRGRCGSARRAEASACRSPLCLPLVFFFNKSPRPIGSGRPRASATEVHT